MNIVIYAIDLASIRATHHLDLMQNGKSIEQFEGTEDEVTLKAAVLVLNSLRESRRTRIGIRRIS